MKKNIFSYIFIFCFSFYFSQSGNIDVSYGNNGISKYTGAFGRALSLDKNGRIIGAGYDSRYNFTKRFAFVRYSKDGILDSSFGSNGAKSITLDGVDVLLNDIAIQSDNKIIACGYIDNNTNRKDYIVIRLNEDGSLDNTFNGNGKVTISFGTNVDEAESLAIQSDGKILVAGSSYMGSYYDYSIARLNGDGTLDNTFSEDGKLTIDIAGNNDYANVVKIDSGGKIFLAGNSYLSTTVFCDFSICKINSDGTLDSTFGNGGKKMIKLAASNNDEAYNIFFPNDNRIIITGVSATETAAIKLLSNGNFDTTFANGGKFIYRFGTNSNYPYACSAIQEDGKIVLGSPYTAGEYRDVGLLRLTSSGNIDTTFGENGISTTSVGNSPSLNQMVLQSDNKILIAGYIDEMNIGIVRFNNTGNYLNTALWKNTNPYFFYKSDYTLIFNEIIETIEIFDMSGRKIQAIYNSKTLPISHLNNGKYIVKMTNRGKTVVDSFIK